MNISITGHRPNKLYGYNIYSKQYDTLRDKYLEVLSYLTSKYNISYLFNGLALGWDTIVFEETHFSHSEIKIVGCIPFLNQPNKWNSTDKQIYELMIQNSSELVYVDTLPNYQLKNTIEGEYDVRKMQRRNEYMVDNSNILVSCWNGVKEGGSWHCIRYALNKQWIKEIININPKTLEIEFLKI